MKQARHEEVKWCRSTGVGETVLRKQMEAEGAKTVSLRWIDTERSDANRTSSIGREGGQQGHEEI